MSLFCYYSLVGSAVVWKVSFKYGVLRLRCSGRTGSVSAQNRQKPPERDVDLMDMEQRTEQADSEPKKLTRTVLEWTEELVLAIVLIAVIFTFLCRIITVTGNSMVPNYNDGDRVLVTGLSQNVEQGDVVVIINVLEEPIIKRVIATEGQTVDFDYEKKAVLVDGQLVEESRFGLPEGITDKPFTSFEMLEFPQKVPEGCVFVLGDNRSISEDSRYKVVGMIDQRNILGKAVFNLFPFQKLGPVK